MTLENILLEAVQCQASDIHITVGASPIFRINGRIAFSSGSTERLLPVDTENMVNTITSDDEKRILSEEGEVDFSYAFKGVGRFRVNVYKQRGSYALALRAVPLTVPTVDEIGLPAAVKELALLNKGLVLVTGPKGSGKSTTLAALIDYINKTRSCHVLTLEDPIEYLHRHQNSVINQREIGHDSKSYAKALKSALRQDPDVILVGELSDIDTIAVALTAAENGHLVFSSMHTLGAVSTIDRLIDMFPETAQQQVRIQLSTVLQGIISKQLLNRMDEQGRAAAYEILVVNTAVRNHIKEGNTEQIINSIQTGKRSGMVSMDSALLELFHKGIVSREEVLKCAIDKDAMSRSL